MIVFDGTGSYKMLGIELYRIVMDFREFFSSLDLKVFVIHFFLSIY